MNIVRRISFLSVVLMGLIVLGGCNSEGSSEANTENDYEINIGWQPSVEVPFYTAQEKNLFEENGISPEFLKFTAGPPMFAALNSGDVDVTYMGTPPAVTALAEDLPVSVIAVEVDASNGEGLVVHPDSGIESLDDLKGKKISVLRGSSSEYALMAALTQNGLTEDDLTILSFDVSTIIPAFEKKEVDGVWVWDPWVTKLETAGGVKIVTNKDVGIGAAGVWVARDEWIENNPEAVKAFIKSLGDANGIVEEDSSLAVSSIQKKLEIEEHEAETILNHSIFPTISEMWDKDYQFSLNPEALDKGEGMAQVMGDLAEFLAEKGQIVKVPDIVEGIDGSIVEELQE